MKLKCCLCRSSKTIQIFSSAEVHGRHKINGRKHDIFRCLNCGVVFIKKSNNYRDLKNYYNYEYFFPKHDRSRLFANFLIKITEDYSFKKKEKFILKYFNNREAKNKISVLDIGCGEGKFLRKISGSFFDKTGFDLKKHIKKNDFDFITGDFLESSFKKKFDVICFWHVLEHLDKPITYLNAAKKLLQKDGIIIISTPNTDGLGFKLGQVNWFHLDTPYHRFLYNDRSLHFILKKVGFAVCERRNENYDYYTDLFWSVRDSKLKYLIYFFYPIIKFFSNETITAVCKRQ